MFDSARPVRVFRNWKHHCYTVMQDGLVCASAGELYLRDVHFVVREAGRQRMLASGVKSVHAYAVGLPGEWVQAGQPQALPAVQGPRLAYDARRAGAFVDEHSGAAVWRASLVWLHGAGVTYLPTPDDEASAGALAIAACQSGHHRAA